MFPTWHLCPAAIDCANTRKIVARWSQRLLWPPLGLYWTPEFKNVFKWALTCNLKLNSDKSEEVFLASPVQVRQTPSLISLAGKDWVLTSYAFLGFTITYRFRFSCIKVRQSLCANRVLEISGMLLVMMLFESHCSLGFPMLPLNELPMVMLETLDDLCDSTDSSHFSAVLHNLSHLCTTGAYNKH